MEDLEGAFENFFRAAGNKLNAQSININFNTSPAQAFLLALLLNDSLDGKKEFYDLLNLNEEGKNELRAIAQEILNQVALKSQFKSRNN